ncbi:Aminopeptidase YpdF (MP-, MA-, MS-, AP-, NP-specific) [hydrothermal vent metagenome]|uniref:Aminopeptidase YpdF (MP-, MA-, MS-, AP-, NP-specific) n=1 Tax=hydrothermal vent metagenome TaxID=652676 RepID=A0A160V621_9ZZZZ
MKERVEGLVAQFQDKELDGVLISAPENRRYLSGFSGSAGYLLITKANAILVTDSRYTEQATNQSPYFDVRQVRGGWNWLIDELKSSGVKKVGFESQDMTVSSYNNLIDAIKGDSALGDVSMVPAPGLAENQRIIKDEEELKMLQLAIDAADKAMDLVCPAITPGMTEKEVAWKMETAMRDFGADAISFDTIVAAGPNGAMAHHQPTDYVIKQRDPIVIDMGAKVGGYCSDLSRSIAVGEPDETFKKVYDTVLGAQLTAINTVKAGMTGEETDNLSRNVIVDAGYGDNFGHSLGHGVGLEIHENPRVGPRSPDVLELDTVFTVEPGIYLSGWGGIRIEDIVILRADGAVPLSKARKAPGRLSGTLYRRTVGCGLFLIYLPQ